VPGVYVEEKVSVGATKSSFTAGSASWVMFPALSAHAARDGLVPSLTAKLSDLAPERASEHETVAVTGVSFQPWAFGAGETSASVAVGGVRSMFTIGDVAVAVLPALSVQEPSAL
jgi:hypothetical protein